MTKAIAKKRMTKYRTFGTMLVLTLLSLGLVGVASAQSWFKQVNGRGRFQILAKFNKEAVLDKETGLVWQRRPASVVDVDWDNASNGCQQLKLGNRMGWRLPTVEELASLVDFSQADPPLPLRHPFLDIQANDYWTGTTFPLNHTEPNVAARVRTVRFAGAGSVVSQGKNNIGPFTWCVRGGQGHDGGVNSN